jgi:uncharacterized protein with FMN-binding domain
MKKYLTSFVFLMLFAGYAALQYLNNSSAAYNAPVALTTTSAAPQQSTTTAVASAQSAPPPPPVQTPTQPTPSPVPVPAPKPQGQYVDGTYSGDPENAYWGMVQVQAVIKNGALASVNILQFPNSHGTSVYINDQALPILQSEAIQAQNANVNGVSGATYTSQAFQQSLASALSQAKS